MDLNMEAPPLTQGAGKVGLRRPTPRDGFALNKLVAASPPLDPNSVYCNLLQCTHFSDTCIAAELDGELVGFVSGYIPPATPNTLFVWQVVIAKVARGQGLAKQMLLQLIRDSAAHSLAQQVRFIETTITPDNEASWALFRSLARALETELESRPFFSRDEHFAGQHDDEHLLQIGPLKGSQLSAVSAPNY